MSQASGISERGPSRTEAWITWGKTGWCHECPERVETWHEVLLGGEDDPLMHAECAEGEDE